MKAVILNGDGGGDAELDRLHILLEQMLEGAGIEARSLKLCGERIGDCNACKACKFCTPGVCVQDDFGRVITRVLATCDLLAIVTPLTFAGYSHLIKRAFDRVEPFFLPFFEKRGGTTRVKLRYAKAPALLVLAVSSDGGEAKKRVLEELVRRNAETLNAPAYATLVLERGAAPEQASQLIETRLASIGRGDE